MEIAEALQKALDFKGLEPVDVETNCGGVWFSDKTTEKKHYILIDECSKQD